MRRFALAEIIEAGRYGESFTAEGVELRYRPQLQREGRALLEVKWPAAWQDDTWRLLEVFRSGGSWACLPARALQNGFAVGQRLRLPKIPDRPWLHYDDCDCTVCCENGVPASQPSQAEGRI